MTSTFTKLTALWMLLAPLPLAAQGQPVVVELFSSQGCSSCPPADALLAELSTREDVLALSLHVDYWDYIGWKDEFARPGNSRRQRGYARASGRDMVYTPQMIVDGQEAVTGVHAVEVTGLIDRHKAEAKPVELAVSRAGDSVSIRLTPPREAAGPQTGDDAAGAYVVHLVQYAPRLHSSITRGENAGRELDYSNVVRDWRILGRWDGQGPATFDAKVADGLRAAVLVQRPDFGPIVGAARAD